MPTGAPSLAVGVGEENPPGTTIEGKWNTVCSPAISNSGLVRVRSRCVGLEFAQTFRHRPYSCVAFARTLTAHRKKFAPEFVTKSRPRCHTVMGRGVTGLVPA